MKTFTLLYLPFIVLIAEIFQFPVMTGMSGENSVLNATVQRALSVQGTMHSIDVSFNVTGIHDNSWSRHRFVVDFEKKKTFNEEFNKPSPQDIARGTEYSLKRYYCQTNKVVSVVTYYKDVDGKKVSGRGCTIERERIDSEIWPDMVIGYNHSNFGIPLSKNGKISYYKPDISLVKHNSIPAVKIISSTIPNIGRSIYIFDAATGLLMERQEFLAYRTEKNELRDKLCWRILPSDYFYKNGIPFPRKIEIRSPKEHYVVTVDTLSCKINEPIPDSTFEPVFPAGIFVSDEINNVQYQTPIIGNLNAEAAIAKELDELFKKTKKK